MELQCKRCLNKVPIEQFKKDKRRPFGIGSYCRPCDNKACARSYYGQRHQRRLGTIKQYYQADKKKYQQKIIAARIRNPLKNVARIKLRNAVRANHIKRLPCKICGDVKSQGHHPDYNKPLNVQWLCQIHHAEIHRKYNVLSLLDNKQKES